MFVVRVVGPVRDGDGSFQHILPSPAAAPARLLCLAGKWHLGGRGGLAGEPQNGPGARGEGTKRPENRAPELLSYELLSYVS